MRRFGLIGYPLSHSFSKKYFAEKFDQENIIGCEYELYEIPEIKHFPALVQDLAGLEGLNVTIPYKKEVIRYLDELDPAAEAIGAVNVITIDKESGKKKGYNSDYYGFLDSLVSFLGSVKPKKALVLGTGGASLAVKKALEDLNIVFKVVSRTPKETNELSYEDLDAKLIQDYPLIINTTPLGMRPNTDQAPDLPYAAMSEGFFLYDLVYNPEETLFMKKGKAQGAKVINGLPMLIGQAEKAWEIWNKD